MHRSKRSLLMLNKHFPASFTHSYECIFNDRAGITSFSALFADDEHLSPLSHWPKYQAASLQNERDEFSAEKVAADFSPQQLHYTPAEGRRRKILITGSLAIRSSGASHLAIGLRGAPKRQSAPPAEISAPARRIECWVTALPPPPQDEWINK